MLQFWPPSSEYAALALTCHATTACCGLLGFTAIEGSLKKPGLGLISVRWAFGAGGSCWAVRLAAHRVRSNRVIFMAKWLTILYEKQEPLMQELWIAASR